MEPDKFNDEPDNQTNDLATDEPDERQMDVNGNYLTTADETGEGPSHYDKTNNEQQMDVGQIDVLNDNFYNYFSAEEESPHCQCQCHWNQDEEEEEDGPLPSLLNVWWEAEE